MKKILVVTGSETIRRHTKMLMETLLAAGCEVTHEVIPPRPTLPPTIQPHAGLSSEKKSKGDKKRARAALKRKGWR